VESGGTVEFDLEIYTFDIDFAGHVSNITYLRWLEIGRLRLLTEAGLPIDELVRNDMAPVLTRTEIDYRVALKLGDPVHLSLDFAELRAASAVMDCQILSGSRVAATARQTGLFISLATGKPRRVTPEMRAQLTRFLRPAAAVR
jgi:acyl-CoA thioester hydrolase